MKKYLGLILAGAAAVALHTAAVAADAPAAAPEAAAAAAKPAAPAVPMIANFKLKTADDKEITQEAFKGKTTVLVIAQTACSQCRAELKAINAAYDELSKKAQIYTVLVDVAPERGIEVYKSLGFKMPVIIDSDFSLGGNADLNATPATMVIDKDLKIKFTKTGWRGGDVESLSEKL